MREIKFRALTQENKIIYEIGSIEFFTDGTIIVNEEIPIKQLIQYTGLKDKNGKEIYEGDIVWSDPQDGRGLCYGQRKFAVEWHYSEWGLSGYPAWNISNAINEVIGNIYENPELLKENNAGD